MWGKFALMVQLSPFYLVCVGYTFFLWILQLDAIDLYNCLNGEGLIKDCQGCSLHVGDCQVGDME